MAGGMSGAMGGLMTGMMSNPWTMVGGLGLQALGSFLGGKSSQPKLMNLPPPKALFPEQQGQYLNQMFQAGGAGPQSLNVLNWFLNNQGGMTDYSNLFNTTVASGQRLQDIGRANLMEKYGVRGMRFSKPMADAAMQYETESTTQLANILAQLAFQTNESAANRSINVAQSILPFMREPAMAFYPGATVTSGGQSGWGNVASSVGGSLQTLALLAQMGMI